MSNSADNRLLKQLPQVNEVLDHPALASFRATLPHESVKHAVREAVENARQSILGGHAAVPSTDEIAAEAANIAKMLETRSLRRVVNATGVILHTNLGRSVLAQEAIDAVNDAIYGYSTLEYDTATMQRGSRHDHCEKLICQLTGAEAALAVNNNAAAVLIVLSEFAADREAIVSRGELVEIGGSFRIPDIIELSHAHMIEVGTTNKTHASDYERALNAQTALMLKVHPSNYQMIGFTESVPIEQLRSIAEAHRSESGERVLVYEDLGSGALISLPDERNCLEPTAAASIKSGADIISFSGDKLLGGPQAGIIIGKKTLINRLKSNPLARALRLDKMTLAALEATLRLYLTPDTAKESIPTLRMLTEDSESTRSRADELAALAALGIDSDCAHVAVIEEFSKTGGGSLPTYDIPTYAVEIRFLKGSAQECGRYLAQECPIPIIARISHEKIVCDARTLIDKDELRLVANGLASYFSSLT